MRCPYCHQQNPQSATRCLRCGQPLSPKKRKWKKSRLGTILFNLGVILVAIIGLLSLISGLRSLPGLRSNSYAGDRVVTGEVIADNYAADTDDYIEPDDAAALESEVTAPEEPVTAPEEEQTEQNEAANEDRNDEAASINGIYYSSSLVEKSAALDGAAPSNELGEGTGSAVNTMSSFYNEKTGSFTLPDSKVVLPLPQPLEGTLLMSGGEKEDVLLLEMETKNNLRISISCQKTAARPEGRSEVIDTAQTDLYSRIGGSEDLYYFLYRPAGQTVSGSIVDCDNSWITQITVTDLKSADSTAYSRQAYQELQKVFMDFEA